MGIHSRIVAYAVLVASLLPAYVNDARAQEELLKPDVPQLDKPAQTERAPLKGGVQHNAKQTSEKKKKKLKAAVKQESFGRLQAGSLDNNRFNSSLDQTRLQSQAESSFGIIGVRFMASPGYPPVVNTVFAGTPAAEVGIVPNDIILAVDGVPTAGLTRDECYDLIVGTPNTPVTLSLKRGNSFFVRTMTRMDLNELSDPRIKRAYMFHL